MNGQATGLAGLASLTEPESGSLGVPFILVTGGKGGVGKSSVALNLAVALGRRNQRVLLVDLDLGLGDLAVMVKLSPARTLEDFFKGDAPIGDCRVAFSKGVDLLSGGSGVSELARPDSARRSSLFSALSELSEDYDLIIGDSAAGIGPSVLAFAAAADCVLCVTAPEPASVTDAYGIIKALDEHARSNDQDIPTPLLVFNRVAGASEAEKFAARLAKVTRRFLSRRPHLIGWLPESISVRDATRSQRDFITSAPGSLAAQSTVRIAGRLETMLSLTKCPDSL